VASPAGPEDEHRREDDDRDDADHGQQGLARLPHPGPGGAAPSAVDEGLGALLGGRPAVPGVGPARSAAGPDDGGQVVVGFLVLDDVVQRLVRPARPGRRPPGLGPQHPGPAFAGAVSRPVPAVAAVGEFPGVGFAPVEQLVLEVCGSEF